MGDFFDFPANVHILYIDRGEDPCKTRKGKIMKKVDITRFDEAKRELENAAYDAFGRGIEIYVQDSFIGEPVTVTINWAAMGSTSIDETLEFATKLEKATELAKSFPYAGYILARNDAEYYEDMYYYIEDDEDEEETQEESCEDDGQEPVPYEYGTIEAFLGDFSEEYDIPAIEDEVTQILSDGRRVWVDEYADDSDGGTALYNLCERYRIYTQEDSEETVPFADSDYIDPEVRDEWGRAGSYDSIIVDIERPRGDGFMDRIVPDSTLEDLDGWGTARAFADELGLEYDETPGDIGINIAMNRMYDICREYDAIRYGQDEALSKHGMAQAWARAIDAELVEDTFEYGTKQSWMQKMEFAEGELAGWQVTVLYVVENEEE